VIDDEPLQADFGFSQADGCDSLEVQFTDRSFNARTYQWRFEGADTDTSSQANPRVTFTEPGLHGVTLTVGDGCNNTATRELDRLVLVERTPQLRTSFSDTTIQPGDTVRLSASGAENIAWRQASGIIQRDGDALVVAPDTNRRYRVRATTDNCGSDTASVLVRVDATSGLPSAAGAHEGWRVYPNPARQVLYLESTGGQASQQATWRMLSTQGRVVARGQVQPGRRATVRVASLAPGLYFLEWTDPRKTYRQRVVLAR
jgi:PKD repeat protein